MTINIKTVCIFICSRRVDNIPCFYTTFDNSILYFIILLSIILDYTIVSNSFKYIIKCIYIYIFTYEIIYIF